LPALVDIRRASLLLGKKQKNCQEPGETPWVANKGLVRCPHEKRTKTKKRGKARQAPPSGSVRRTHHSEPNRLGGGRLGRYKRSGGQKKGLSVKSGPSRNHKGGRRALGPAQPGGHETRFRGENGNLQWDHRPYKKFIMGLNFTGKNREWVGNQKKMAARRHAWGRGGGLGYVAHREGVTTLIGTDVPRVKVKGLQRRSLGQGGAKRPRTQGMSEGGANGGAEGTGSKTGKLGPTRGTSKKKK